MDRTEEEIFLTNFIEKRIRNRIKLELSSEGNRRDALLRFSHRTEEMIIKSNIYSQNKHLTPIDILKMLKKLGAPKVCYVLSLNVEVDGKTMELEKAIDACYGYGMPSIIVCIPDHLAYIECEQEQSSASKYILYK